MRVLVTGGAGFIGSHLVDLLVEKGHTTTVLDNLDPQVHGKGAIEPIHIKRHVESGAVNFVRGDVTDRAVVERCLDGSHDVVHLAAAVGVGQSMYQPYYYIHTNCEGSGVLLDCIVQLRSRARRLVVASSMSIYGEGAYRCPRCDGDRARARDEAQLQAGRWEATCSGCGADLAPKPTPESKPAEIHSIYAATKKHQEELFVSFGRAYGIPTYALRFFNVYGPRQSLSNPYTGVAAIFLSRLLNGREPLVFEDGEQSRDFVHVRDVARAIVLALESDGAGTHVLNVGTGRRLGVVAVANALARTLNVEIEPRLLGRYRSGDIRHCYADPTLAREVLGFEAGLSFEEGLPELIEWCRAQSSIDTVEASLDELERQGLVR